MRRTATLFVAITAALSLTAAPALAHGGKGNHQHGKVTSAAAKAKAKPVKAAKTKAKPAKAKAQPITLSGTISSTPTATVLGSSTSVRLTLSVKGGTRQYHRTVTDVVVAPTAVVKRNDQRVLASSLQAGDKVSVKAVRTAEGVVVASRVNAEGAPIVTAPAPEPAPAGQPVPTDSGLIP